MNINIFNYEEFIKLNSLKEITDPIMLDRGYNPTPFGIFSTDIFGRTENDRKTTWAYVNLYEYFFNPFVYKIIKRLDRRIESIVAGIEKYIINDNGDLIEDNEKGFTGIKFLYDNWEKIKFKSSESEKREERLLLLKGLKKNVIFTKYFLICPPFYRDINLQKKQEGKLGVDPINEIYSKLIRLVSSLGTSEDEYDIVGNMTRAKIQMILVDIYNYFINKIRPRSGIEIDGKMMGGNAKDGIMRQFVLGKSIDYGARAVISTPKFNVNNFNEMKVNFQRTGVPLSICCTIFYPFILKWVKDFFENEFALETYPFMDKEGNMKKIKLKDPKAYFNNEYIQKNIDLYIHSYSDRFKRIEIPNEDGLELYMKISGRKASIEDGKPSVETSPLINRHATWTDILYLAAVDSTEDKCITITRYPVTDYLSLFPSMVTVLSTRKTVPMYIDDKFYQYYPYIDLSLSPSEVETSFTETLELSNLFLKALGGDYDGDMVSIRGEFTQESNEELRKKIIDKTNILNIAGQNIRSTEREAVQALYNLTKK
jgi:hypothetical protein